MFCGETRKIFTRLLVLVQFAEHLTASPGVRSLNPSLATFDHEIGYLSVNELHSPVSNSSDYRLRCHKFESQLSHITFVEIDHEIG